LASQVGTGQSSQGLRLGTFFEIELYKSIHQKGEIMKFLAVRMLGLVLFLGLSQQAFAQKAEEKKEDKDKSKIASEASKLEKKEDKKLLKEVAKAEKKEEKKQEEKKQEAKVEEQPKSSK